MQQSDTIASLAAALAKAQATMEGAIKGRANPAFKGTKYADLSSVWEACREQLVTNGLSVVQFPGEMVDNRMQMTTQLCHESGEWMRATLSIPLSKVDAQGYGSAVTYARRYALAAVVGVCPEDDDGNAASVPASRRDPDTVRRQETPAVITEDQHAMIMTMAEKGGIGAREICDKAGVDAVKKMPASLYADCVAWMERKIAAKVKANPQSSDVLSDEIPY